MKNYFNIIPLLFFIVAFNVACTTQPVTSNLIESPKSGEVLYVYQDGKMALNSRYVDRKDVVIYSDGRGGEKAAIKVYVPIHSAFYRDSIVVVRVVNKFEEAISQNERDEVNTVN